MAIAVCLPVFCRAALPQLSPNSLVSLLVCSPDPHSYAGTFGHVAVRIQDASLKIDVAFNDGIYDAKDPFLAFKFILGGLEASLEGCRFTDFVETYRFQGRGVQEYYLDMTLAERQALWEYWNDILIGGNRFYRFNFTEKNCCTQTRDVLFDVLSLDTGFYKGLSTGYSYRDVELSSPFPNAWLHLLFNLLVSRGGDETCSFYEAAFHPAGLLGLLQAVGEHGHPLLLGEKEILPVTAAGGKPGYWMPVTVFSLLLLIVLVLSVFQYKGRRRGGFRWLDNGLFAVTGLFGLLVLWVAMASDVSQVGWCNLNLLWAFPGNLLLVIGRKAGWKRYVARVACGLDGLFLLLAVWGWQHVPSVAVLLALTLMIRTFYYSEIFNFKKVVDETK